MYREIIKKLEEWKKSKNRKPLILNGVRQTGKTWILKEFGNKYYENVAYFNFEGNEPLIKRFEQDLDIERLIEELGVINKKPIKPHSTLVIFDEIGFCNKAITSLKYFNENANDYHIVCAGSLLGITLSKPLSFPVGKVDFLTMHPMTFREFLFANNEEALVNAISDKQDKISELYEVKLLSYLKNYYIVGGMPEVVNEWCNNKDITVVEDIQEKILNAYYLDFAKHAPDTDFPKISLLWKSIPDQLAKENKKFIYSKVQNNMKSKDLESPLEWLISAGMVHKVKRIEKPNIPISAYADKTAFKLYVHDVGLLRKMARLPVDAILLDLEYFKEFRGALAENYVLNELIALDNEEPYYWTSGNLAEVDFVKQFGIDIVPIEVKYGKETNTKSLTRYKEKYGPRISVKTNKLNINISNDTLNIPLYYIWNIQKYI